MSRYAEVEQLIANLDNGLWGKDWDKALAEAIIRDAPSIDIVRCRECKYWKSTVQMPNGTEVKCLYGRKPDDFCSYGERKGE